MTRIPVMRRWAASTAALGPYIPYAGAIALILAAPFETIQPVVTLRVQSFTNVELVISVVLTGWAMWWLVTGERLHVKTALTTPALLLLGSMVLSMLMAPGYQQEALHFTVRFAVGFLAYLLVVNSATSRRRLLGLMMAASLAGTVVAGLGILEYRQMPAAIEWLRPFKAGQVLVGGKVRVSSTLQYPTITSMYLELVFGLTVGLLLLAVSRHRQWVAGLVFIALGLMAETIILTLSRSGLIALAGMLAVVSGLWLMRCGIDSGFWAIAALAAMIAGLLGYRLFNDSMLWLRLTTENDESWYKVQYQVPARLELQTGQIHQVDVTLRNVGRATWQPDGDTPFRLAYHWLDSNTEQVFIFEGLRTEFPHAVRPGQSIELRARVQAPPRPGRYRLAWDVLQEGRLWFSTKNSPSAYSLAIVRGVPVNQPQPAPMPVPQPNPTVDRRTLWWLAGRMLAEHPLLGVGPDNFRLLYGSYAGLEIWNRGLHTNNMYIEFFVDTGLIGGVLFLWLLWRVLVTLRRAWQKLFLSHVADTEPSGALSLSKGRSEGAIEVAELAWLSVHLGITAAVVAFLLHGLVDYFFEFTPTYLVIWMTLGLTTALMRCCVMESRTKRAQGRPCDA